jgi:hypothetical protein
VWDGFRARKAPKKRVGAAFSGRFEAFFGRFEVFFGRFEVFFGRFGVF